MSTSRPTNPDHDEQPPSKQRPALTQRTYHSLVDRRVKAAEAEGAFEDLPGAGKPLRLDDDSMVPEEDRIAYRLLKNAGFAPPWIEMQKTIREARGKLESWLKLANSRWSYANPQERSRMRSEWQNRVEEFNRLILSYNLIVPPAAGQLPMLRLKEELARLG